MTRVLVCLSAVALLIGCRTPESNPLTAFGAATIPPPTIEVPGSGSYYTTPTTPAAGATAAPPTNSLPSISVPSGSPTAPQPSIPRPYSFGSLAPSRFILAELYYRSIRSRADSRGRGSARRRRALQPRRRERQRRASLKPRPPARADPRVQFQARQHQDSALHAELQPAAGQRLPVVGQFSSRRQRATGRLSAGRAGVFRSSRAPPTANGGRDNSRLVRASRPFRPFRAFAASPAGRPRCWS